MYRRIKCIKKTTKSERDIFGFIYLIKSMKSFSSDSDNESDLQDNQNGCLQDDPKRPLRHMQTVVTLRPCSASRNLYWLLEDVIPKVLLHN